MLVRELRHSDVTRVYVVKLRRRTDRRVLRMLAGHGRAAHQHACGRGLDARRGIATALLEHVLADVIGAGALQATLEVRRSNIAALRLYERLGFVVAAVRPKYYSDPDEDALILWRHDLREPAGGSP